MVFSEESSQAIFKMAYVELIQFARAWRPAGRKTRFWGRVAFVSHVQVGEDRKLFASSRVGEPKPTGDDTQTAPTKVGIPPKIQAEVTVRPPLWLVFFTVVCCSFQVQW